MRKIRLLWIVAIFITMVDADITIMDYLNKKAIGSVSITGSIIVTIKATLIFILLFIVLVPLLFIPMFGQVVMLYLWSILLKSPTIYDVGGLFISDKQVLKKRSKKSTTIAMIASLFNYIPLLNIFAPIFAQILFLHHILGTMKE